MVNVPVSVAFPESTTWWSVFAGITTRSGCDSNGTPDVLISHQYICARSTSAITLVRALATPSRRCRDSAE